jgi:hypothetical protein
LQKKQLNGQGGVEHAITPLVMKTIADLVDLPIGNKTMKLGLDLKKRTREIRHPWPPLLNGALDNTILTGGHVSRQRA